MEKLLPPKERNAPISDWTIHSREEFDHPQDADGRQINVFDYYGMLLYLRRAELHEVEDEVVLYVATSKGPQPYRILVSEVRSATRTLTDLRSGRKRAHPVRELRLRITFPPILKGLMRAFSRWKAKPSCGSKRNRRRRCC